MISMEDVQRVDKTLAIPENLNKLVSFLRELGWPQEMLDTHSKGTPPFSEFRNTLLNIDKYGTPKLQIIDSRDLLLDTETMADRWAKFDKYVVDKDTGKKRKLFNLGPRNDWKKILSNQNSETIEKAFKEEMLELGYL